MRTILITGVSRGIGKALAHRFLKNGDFVIGTSKSGNIDWQDKNVLALSLDLADPESIKRCTEQIIALNRKVDVFINNAGIWSGTEDDPVVYVSKLRKVLEVNLIGTIDFTERLIGILNKDAHLINISSRAGSLEKTHHSNYPDYQISKAALNMFTRVLALRLAGKATVSSVHPGWVKTDMGGADADITPTEAAEDIFNLAGKQIESGQFWFKGEKYPW